MLLFISACGNNAINGTPVQRIPLARAEELVRAMIYEKMPDMDPAAQLPLKEMTTDEIWEQLGVQVFKVTEGSIYSDNTYLIKDGKVDHIGIETGGYGVTSMQVVKFGESGELELVYTFSWGSGLHRSELAAYCSNCVENHIIRSNLVYLYGDLTLDKVNEHKVLVKVGHFDIQKHFVTEATLGELTLTQNPNGKRLGVLLNNDLPQRIKERIKIIEP